MSLQLQSLSLAAADRPRHLLRSLQLRSYPPLIPRSLRRLRPHPQTEDPVSPAPVTATPSDPPTTDESVPPPTAGPLALADFFHPSSSWVEGRYGIASKQNISGISSIVDSCSDSYAVSLELRLANNFQKLSFTVGQDNNSNSSDQTLIVRVTGNNKQIEVHPVPFNTLQKFEIPVSGVNATTIEMYLDNSNSNCGGRVNAVLYDVELQ